MTDTVPVPARLRAGFLMRKEQKTQVVDELAAQLGDAQAIYAVDYRGISVPQAAELRASLREQDASFRVVKNTLTLRAADKAGVEAIKELVADGPTALTFVRGDAALAAKALDTFSRRANVLEVKGGLLEGRVLAPEDVRSLARLPSREVLTAQFAGVVASPLTGLVRGLGSMVAGLAVALAQVRDKKEAEAPPPPAEAQAPAKEESPPDEEAQSAGESTEAAGEADQAQSDDEQHDEQSEAEQEAQ
jgi:large subunit ribosomal protein L10